MGTRKRQILSLVFGIALLLANSPVTFSGVDQTVTTSFTVTIPYWTPETESIYLTGSMDALGSNLNPVGLKKYVVGFIKYIQH
jgi:hypothetical protein